MLRGTMRPPFLADACRLAVLGLLLAARMAMGQEFYERDDDLADRPIAEIRIEGVGDDVERLVRNNIRAAVGDPYEADTVRGDVNRLYNIGRFKFVTAEATLTPDGSVAVLYALTLQPTIQGVQTIGNRAVSDQELRAIIQQVPGGPRDEFLIERAKRNIKELYRKKGYYLTDVSVNETELETRGLLIFQVIEGPRVRIKAIEFDGAVSFTPRQLSGQIKTRKHVLLLRPGVLDEGVIANDKSALDSFYKGRGFRDVRIGHTVQLSPDNREAKIIFHISEGPQFTLRSVRAERMGEPGEPPRVFSEDQLAALLDIKSGDVYSADRVVKSLRIIEDAYGMMGYLNVRVEAVEERASPDRAEVDLRLVINEGERATIGLITIDGNFLTRDKVVRRLLRLRPGRPYDSLQLAESERRIARSRLFNNARVTVQDPDPENPEQRDLLVEVKERNTGSVNFGLAVGSDSGVFGEFSIVQNNFDVADLPASLSELITGRAFRGAGQQFSMTFRPGNEIFQYSMSLTEPHLFDTDYSFNITGAWRQRQFSDYDEERLTTALRLGRRLGDVWQIATRTRFERVELTDIDSDAPVDVFEDAGPDNLTSVGITLTRTTIGTITRPGRGSRLEISLDQFGALGGEYDFTKAEIDYTVFLTLDEDFLGRKSTLKLNTNVGYIFGGTRSPTYERFYRGGRTFRGFDFREISPKGIRNDTGQLGDDPVGGEWMFFTGAQYEFPLFQETVTGVFFLDTGTVLDDFGFSQYRVSVGAGVRLYIAALGPVPIAFDFGVPITKEDADDTRVLSFSAELPF
jgi:outer membrane protein insertion porin family